MGRQRQLLATLLLAVISLHAAGQDIQPLIPPGYVPTVDEGEKGLWVEMEDYERALQRSALRVREPELNAYVSSVMCRVAGNYCGDIKIYVMRNPNFNASMGPNGVSQVWTGLLLRVSSEAELAAVLGHELAHYTQLHSLERMRQISKAMSAGSVVDLGLAILGLGIPVGQMTALASASAFSRENEREADQLGVEFMAAAGYDPHAAARVWRMIVAEEERAVVKREQPNIFTMTHPSSEDRVAELEAYVAARYDAVDETFSAPNRHVQVLDLFYPMLMEDQIDTNRFGRTEAMLERHREIGVDESLVNFFLGEMYRQRGEEGDLARAEQAYRLSTSGAFPFPAAYQQLGYLYMKQGESDLARENFEKYLELEPDSDERAMIEFYLEDM
jgi:predicted Zn-dependent protease